VAFTVAGELVVEFGEDELEDFLENVHAGVGEHFVFHAFNEIAQRAGEAAFAIAFVFLFNERVNRPRLAGDVLDGLRGGGQIGNGDEIVRVFAMPDNGSCTVAPERERRSGGVTTGFELIFAGLQRRRFYLDHAVGDVLPVGVPDDDAGALGSVAAEGDGHFNGEPAHVVFVSADELFEPKLTDDFLRLGGDLFVAHETTDDGFSVLVGQTFFDVGDNSRREEIEGVRL